MKLLVVKTSSLGDVVHTLPAVTDAARHVAGITIDWCVEEAFAPVAALHPAVRTIHRVAIRRWRRTFWQPAVLRQVVSLRGALRGESYDLVIDAQGLMKSALVARLAGARIIGFDRASAREPLAALAYHGTHAVARDRHAIIRTRQLFAQELGYAIEPEAIDFGLPRPPRPGNLPADRLHAFLLHGTSRESKKWSAEGWIETARMIVQRGMTPVTTYGDDDEKTVAEAIADAVPETRLVRKTGLDELAAIVGNMRLVIGTDSGLTHLASAFGIPTVALFFTTEPGLTGPRGRAATTLLADVDRASPHKALAPDRVMRAAQALMDQE